MSSSGKYYYKNTDLANLLHSGSNSSNNNQGFNSFPGTLMSGLTTYERDTSLNYLYQGVDLATNRVAYYAEVTDLSNTTLIGIPNACNYYSIFLKGAGGGGGGGGGGQFNTNANYQIPAGGGGGGGGGGGIFLYRQPINAYTSFAINLGGGGNGGAGGNNSNSGTTGNSGGTTTVVYNNAYTFYFSGGNGGNGGGGAFVGAGNSTAGNHGLDGTYSLDSASTITPNYINLNGSSNNGVIGVVSDNSHPQRSDKQNSQNGRDGGGRGFTFTNIPTYINDANINSLTGGGGGSGSSNYAAYFAIDTNNNTYYDTNVYNDGLHGLKGLNGYPSYVRVYFYIN
jgi:hypothetical protein